MKKDKVISFSYILPVVVLAVIVFLAPIIYAVYISFTNMGGTHVISYIYVGLANYIFIFKYGYFLYLLKNSLIWTLGGLVTYVTLGFALALILNQSDLKGRSVFFALLVLPWAFPAFIALLVWSGMWVYPYGIMNSLILPMLHLPKINPIGSTTDGWIALIVSNDWLSFPYFMIVFYAALQSVPRELYDIAELDGAGAFTKFLNITLPYIRRLAVFVSLGTIIYTWNNFYPIYLITEGQPGISTNSIVSYAYEIAFGVGTISNSDYSLAAAWSVISTVIIIVLGIIVIKYTHILDQFI